MSSGDEMDDSMSPNVSVEASSEDEDDKSAWLKVGFYPAMSKDSFKRPNFHTDHFDNTLRSDDSNGVSLSSTADTTAMEVLEPIEWTTTSPMSPKARSNYTLVAARNQIVAVQLRVTSNQPFLLTTDESNWLSAVGHTSRARVFLDTSCTLASFRQNTQLFIIGYVEDENDNLAMEYLDPRNYSPHTAAKHSVYIRIHVPQDMPSSTLDIPVYVYTQAAGFGDECMSWVGNLQLQIADVVLPSPKDWSFHLDLWQHLTSIARAHMVPIWSDQHFDLIDRYLKCLSRLGQKAVSVVASEAPWAGQQCYLEEQYPSALFEQSVVQAQYDSKNGLSVDFSTLGRLIEIAEPLGMTKEIEVFGLMAIWTDPRYGFDGVVTGAQDYWRIRCYDLDEKRFFYLSEISQVEVYIKAIHDYFESAGFLDQVRICVDEPNDPKVFRNQVDFLKRTAPGFKLKVAVNKYEFIQHAPPEVVDFVPLLPLACRDIDKTHDLNRQVHQNGGKMSWYLCCSPKFPNTFVSSPLVEGRLIGWLTHILKLDGFLRWNFCLWPAHPWYSLRWRTASWPVGDMYFVLPGLNGDPVETLRYEALRMAVQDFELLKMVERTLSSSAAAKLISEATKLILRTDDVSDFAKVDICDINATDLYSLDPNDYESATHLIIEALASKSL